MKKILLSQGKFSLVDDEDFEWLNQWKWSYASVGYAYRVIQKSNKRTQILMHRLIMNTPENLETDHKDLNKLNNQRSNLRTCTSAQNRRNTGIKRNNKSGYKGVSWDKGVKKWRAQIKFKENKLYIGIFDNPIDAASAYNGMATKYFGEFAYLNKL